MVIRYHYATFQWAATIHCVEMSPRKGRATCTFCWYVDTQLLAREGEYAQLRLRSGEIRKVHIDCRATIGEVGNGEHNLAIYW